MKDASARRRRLAGFLAGWLRTGSAPVSCPDPAARGVTGHPPDEEAAPLPSEAGGGFSVRGVEPCRRESCDDDEVDDA